MREARARRSFAELEAVVEVVADALMCEAVKLRADMSEVADDELLVRDALVRACGRPATQRLDTELTPRAHRNVRMQDIAELDHLPRANELRRAQDCFGPLQIAMPALVAVAPR
jgi:hypothetical protein